MLLASCCNKNILKKKFTKHYHIQNIFLTIIAIIIIVISILSLGMYNYFKDVSLKSTNNYIKDSLSQVSTAAHTMKDMGESLSLQLLNERDMIPLLSPTAPSANQLSLALQRLDTYTIMNSQIHSIYIYNGYSDTFYTTLPSEGLQSKNTFFDKNIVSILQQIKEYDTSLPLPRSIPNHTNTFNSVSTSNVYTFIRYTTTIYNNKEVITAAIVNLSEQYLQELIQSMSNNQPDIFIVNKDGTLISSIRNYPMLTDLSSHSVIQSVTSSSSNSGYFLEMINGALNIVTYISSSQLDNWYFVQFTPYSSITKDLANIRNYTLLAGFILFILGGIYTFIASKKLSSPIYLLEDTVHTLKEQSRENTTELKYHFLNSLLVRRETISNAYIEQQFIKHKVSLDPYSPYKIILLDVKTLASPPTISPTEEPHLLTYSVINIVEELGMPLFNCTCIPVADLRILCLLNVHTTHSSEALHLQIEHYLDTVLDRCKKLLNITLQTTVSTIGEDLTLLPTLYQDTIGSSLYHLIYQGDSPIFQEFIESVEATPFTYPQELHQFLFDNLKLGNLTDVTRIYHQIIDYTCNYSYTAFINTLLHLAFTINMTISKLNIDESLLIKHNQNNFIALIQNADNLDIINQAFTQLFETICEEINSCTEQRKEKNYDDLIHEVYRLIDLGYSNPDTCIQSIADQLNISAAYLGRLFTKLTEESITQCITNKRLDIACQLLADSTEPIAQISESCGFSSINYFYKVFKKAYGITPSNYRKNASS